MLPREVRDSGWTKKCPKVEVDQLPRPLGFDEMVPPLADIPLVVNSGGHEDVPRAIFMIDGAAPCGGDSILS